MKVDFNKTVGQLTTEIPGASRIFEGFGIDYCCGGNQPLEKACKNAGIAIEKVLFKLEESKSELALKNTNYKNWQKEPVEVLADYIVENHHTFTRVEIDGILKLVKKVINKHGEKHSELYQVYDLVYSLFKDLLQHMQKEEIVLFPYIKALAKSLKTNAPLPLACFSTVASPIRIMSMEHETAGEILAEIRELTSNFTAPEGVCNSYKMLYQRLLEFEQDLHMHIHLENNILFPRALELENKVQEKTPTALLEKPCSCSA